MNRSIFQPPIEGTLDGWGSVTSILHKTLTDMQSSNGSDVYTPSQLLKAIASRLHQFSGGDQHDSHELLSHLLELVRNEDLRVRNITASFYNNFNIISYQ